MKKTCLKCGGEFGCSTMKDDVKFLMKMTIRERRYAQALSRRLPNCPLPIEGSAAHAFKWLLHEKAKQENVDIG